MTSLPPQVPSVQTLGGTQPIGIWRWLAVGASHVAALTVMFLTEPNFEQRLFFGLAWGLLNALWLCVLRRPALSGALSFAMLTVLVLLSRLKHDIMQMTVNFVDVMVIDRDTIAFLFTIMPKLGWPVLAAFIAAVPVGMVLWRFDPFRVRRLTAAAVATVCLAGLAGLEAIAPDDPWEGYLRGGYVSKFARSGVAAVSELRQHGFMESDAAVAERLRLPLEDACHPAGRRPHIIMVHDESSFDIRQAEGIKVPAGYGRHFLSGDSKTRKFMVETSGGASWFTEYNVLAGLSSRSFGRFSYFVTRLAAGRVEHGLPLALARCGYTTTSLYPAHGAFMNARQFHMTTGIQNFYDARDLGAKGLEPDRFFYNNALRMLSDAAGKPQFMYVYLGANHFPWAGRLRPDLTPAWRDPGNTPKIDEYLRRQSMSADDYRDFLAQLKQRFPNEPFLIVRYGDHQPEFSSSILEPKLDDVTVARQHATFYPRYFSTYYAIDAVNFKPAASTLAMEKIDAPYLPLVVQEAAGIPLDPAFDEQKKIMLRCKGVFYGCKDGAEARRFNRLLIDAGFIKNL